MIISYEKRQPSVLTIICDGEPWRRIHSVIFGRNPALPPSCMTLNQLEDWFLDQEWKNAKNYCFKRLSRQAMHSTQLAKALRDRLVSQATIDKVLQGLVEMGLLNDQEWVASVARLHQQRRYGPNAIRAKLAAKGIRYEGERIAPEAQQESIRYLLETRYRSRDLSVFKERQKVMAALIRRGFDIDLVGEVLRTCLNR